MWGAVWSRAAKTDGWSFNGIGLSAPERRDALPAYIQACSDVFSLLSHTYLTTRGPYLLWLWVSNGVMIDIVCRKKENFLWEFISYQNSPSYKYLHSLYIFVWNYYVTLWILFWVLLQDSTKIVRMCREFGNSALWCLMKDVFITNQTVWAVISNVCIIFNCWVRMFCKKK